MKKYILGLCAVLALGVTANAQQTKKHDKKEKKEKVTKKQKTFN